MAGLKGGFLRGNMSVIAWDFVVLRFGAAPTLCFFRLRAAVFGEDLSHTLLHFEDTCAITSLVLGACECVFPLWGFFFLLDFGLFKVVVIGALRNGGVVG